MTLPHSCDALIHGGTLSAWATALALKERGWSVGLTTPLTYLLEDLTGVLDLNQDLSGIHPLFEGHRDHGTGWLKSRAEEAIIDAGIPYLYNTHLGDLVAEGTGFEALLVHRGGQQTLRAQRFIDGSTEGWALRRFSGLSTQLEGLTWRTLGRGPSPHHEQRSTHSIQNDKKLEEHLLLEWQQKAPCDMDFRSFSRHCNSTRVASFAPGQSHSAALPELRFEASLQSEEALPWAHPGPMSTAEQRVQKGQDLAAQLSKASATAIQPNKIALPKGEARWLKEELRNLPLGELPRGVEAVDEFDVLVVGGGTGGAPAGIGAARRGATTLVVEACPALGGVGTQGAIGRYWFGNRVGFTAEIDESCRQLATTEQHKAGWDVECKQHWYLKSLVDAGGECWFHSMVVAAIVEADRVLGAIIATPGGLRAVYAKATVDSTGSSDLCAAAGAQTVAIGSEHVALQGTGLCPVVPGESYTNTDFDFIDDNDVLDTTTAFTSARKKFRHVFDVCNLVDSRERRRIVGDVEVSPMDIRLGRTFLDAMVKAHSNFDTHGFTVHPFFLIQPPDHAPLDAFVPLRAMLPKGLKGIVVTGLGISAHRDAMPVLRMQADVQNQGYAAGYAATWVESGDFRDLDMADLQKHLIEIGNLDPADLASGDSFPLPQDDIEGSLQSLQEDFSRLDRVFTLPPAQLLEALRSQYAKTPCLNIALVLGMLGDGTGVADLKEALQKSEWDEGWNYRGMGQFGRSISPFDALVLAYGRCSNDASLLIQLAQAVPHPTPFSHVRVLVEAFESIGDAAAVPVLEELLRSHGGHQQLDTQARLEAVSDDPCDNTPRNHSLIELHLARAIFRLAPQNPLATETLEGYGRDLRATFARHAQAVLGA